MPKSFDNSENGGFSVNKARFPQENLGPLATVASLVGIIAIPSDTPYIFIPDPNQVKTFFKRWIINTVIALLILTWTLWPVVCVAIGMAIASYAGAPLDEGSKHPTMINGVDYGDTAYTLFVMGWFGMVTIPTGLMALAVQAIIATTEWLMALARKRRAQAR